MTRRRIVQACWRPGRWPCYPLDLWEAAKHRRRYGPFRDVHPRRR